MSPIRSLRIAIVSFTLFASASVFAHPKLLSTTPTNHATVAAPASINLSFSETLLPVSGADLVMTKMPGMTMPPMKIEAKAAPSADGKTLTVTPVKPLQVGTYRVDWHVVSTDTHAVKGTFEFTVK